VTPRKRNDRGTALLAVLVLAVAGLYLAFRSWGAASVAFAPLPVMKEPRVVEHVPQVVAAAAMDSTLARMESPDRDPFRPPAAARGNEVRRHVPPPLPDPPQLRMILVDQVSPEVQLAVGDDLSGRLQNGQSFRGWKVISITPGACIVENGGRTITLTPRRSP
jgi:hypothetical protein